MLVPVAGEKRGKKIKPMAIDKGKKGATELTLLQRRAKNVRRGKEVKTQKRTVRHESGQAKREGQGFDTLGHNRCPGESSVLCESKQRRLRKKGTKRDRKFSRTKSDGKKKETPGSNRAS